MDCARLFDIRGKTALVTGGSGGIGYMIAEGLLSAGVDVTIVARKNETLSKAAERLRSFGEVRSMSADLATEAGIAQVAEAVIGAGPLHILVNNAGATWGAPLEQFPRTGFEKILDINLVAPFELTRALLPALRAAATPDDPARIINISSVEALQVPQWESYPYSASKAAIGHLSRHLGKFLAKDHISVNCIAPGCFPSRMTESVLDFDDEDDMARVASPLGARVGQRSDIVGATVFLSSLASAWISGVTIPVSGGVGTID